MTLVLALKELHARELIHGDIKPSNVLVGSFRDGPIGKLGDFGGARVRHEGVVNSASIAFSAPEVLEGNAETKQSDVYSLGLVISYVLTRTFLFDRSRPIMRLLRDIETGGRIQLPGAKAEVADLLQRKMSVKAETCRSTEEVLVKFCSERFAFGDGVDVERVLGLLRDLGVEISAESSGERKCEARERENVVLRTEAAKEGKEAGVQTGASAGTRFGVPRSAADAAEPPASDRADAVGVTASHEGPRAGAAPLRVATRARGATAVLVQMSPWRRRSAM
jgi:hypothetical protein